MAFTTIVWNGTGVIANCDGLSDSIGGTWAELGGGGISYNTDQYLTGSGSIGGTYASKSGFNYYTTVATYDFDTAGTEEGQYIYIWINISSASAFDTLANNGFSFVVGTDTSNYRTYKLAGSGAGEANGWPGGWKLFVIDPTIAGSIADTGTFNLATINMIGLWMDTIVSVRADTVFIDQVAIAKGLRVTGTGTVDEIITYCAQTLASRAWGVFQEREGIGYSYGSLTVGDNASATVNSALTSEGNVIQYGISEFYHDTNGWSLTHPADYNQIVLEKHTSYTTDYTADNTNLFGAIDATLGVSNETGATLNYAGGGFRYLPVTTMSDDMDISGAVYSGCLALKPNGATFNNNTIGETLQATTSGAMELVAATDLDTISNIVFNNFTGKYAVYIPAAVTGTISFNNFTGDGSGTDVYWAGTSGTLTINKSNGTDLSTWSSGGGTVALVSSVSIAVNVKDQQGANIIGAYVYIDEDLEAAGEIINTTTDTSGNVNTSYSGAATSATVRVRKYGYKPSVGVISLTADSSTNVILITDPQQT